MKEITRVPRLADLPEVLTVPEVAQVLRISQSLVRKLINEGDLPGLGLGDRQLVSNELLQRWIGAGRGPRSLGTEAAPVRKGKRKEGRKS